jgi:hypothetical protein
VWEIKIVKYEREGVGQSEWVSEWEIDGERVRGKGQRESKMARSRSRPLVHLIHPVSTCLHVAGCNWDNMGWLAKIPSRVQEPEWVREGESTGRRWRLCWPDRVTLRPREGGWWMSDMPRSTWRLVETGGLVMHSTKMVGRELNTASITSALRERRSEWVSEWRSVRKVWEEEEENEKKEEDDDEQSRLQSEG